MEQITMNDVDELYNKYDEVINIIMVNLYTLSKDAKKIVLEGINRKNEDHLLVLRVALMAKDIYGFPLALDVGFWDSFVLNWRARKITRHIPREKDSKIAISVPEMVNFMYDPIREYLGKNFKFADIYDAFYRKELG